MPPLPRQQRSSDTITTGTLNCQNSKHIGNEANNPIVVAPTEEEASLSESEEECWSTDLTRDDEPDDADYEESECDDEEIKHDVKRLAQTHTQQQLPPVRSDPARNILGTGSDKSSVARLNRDLRNAKSRRTRDRKMIERLEVQVKALQCEKRQDGEKLRKLRLLYSRKIETNPVIPQDEHSIVAAIERFSARCNTFSKTYTAGPSVIPNLTEYDKSTILDPLLHRYRAIAPNGTSTVFATTNACEILLDTTINHTIYVDILTRPLYFLHTAAVLHGPACLESDLYWLSELCGTSRHDTALSNTLKWQAMLIKTLLSGSSTDTNEPEERKASRNAKKGIKLLKDTYFQQLAESVERTCWPILAPLSDEEQMQRRTYLVHLFRAAGDLSKRIWTQGVLAVTKSLAHNQEPFSIASTLVKPHPTLLLDQEDTSRDGQGIYLVVKPRIEVTGDASGSFIQPRSWGPAVVLMAAPGEL